MLINTRICYWLVSYSEIVKIFIYLKSIYYLSLFRITYWHWNYFDHIINNTYLTTILNDQFSENAITQLHGIYKTIYHGHGKILYTNNQILFYGQSAYGIKPKSNPKKNNWVQQHDRNCNTAKTLLLQTHTHKQHD